MSNFNANEQDQKKAESIRRQYISREGNMTMGLALSIPGLIVALLAIPIYALITASRKKKYAFEIMRLSDSLMHQ